MIAFFDTSKRPILDSTNSAPPLQMFKNSDSGSQPTYCKGTPIWITRLTLFFFKLTISPPLNQYEPSCVLVLLTRPKFLQTYFSPGSLKIHFLSACLLCFSFCSLCHGEFWRSFFTCFRFKCIFSRCFCDNYFSRAEENAGHGFVDRAQRTFWKELIQPHNHQPLTAQIPSCLSKYTCFYRSSMCICVYLFLCVLLCVFTQVCFHSCVCMRVCGCVRVCNYVCFYMCVLACAFVLVFSCVCVWLWLLVQASKKIIKEWKKFNLYHWEPGSVEMLEVWERKVWETRDKGVLI